MKGITYEELNDEAQRIYQEFLKNNSTPQKRDKDNKLIAKSTNEKIEDLQKAKKALSTYIGKLTRVDDEDNPDPRKKEVNDIIAKILNLSVSHGDNYKNTEEWAKLNKRKSDLFDEIVPDYKNAYDAFDSEIQSLKKDQDVKFNVQNNAEHISDNNLRKKEYEEYKALAIKQKELGEEIENSYLNEDGSLLSKPENENASLFLKNLFSAVDKYSKAIDHLNEKLNVKGLDISTDSAIKEEKIQNIISAGINAAKNSLFSNLKEKLKNDKPITEKDLTEFDKILVEAIPTMGSSEVIDSIDKLVADTKAKEETITNKKKEIADYEQQLERINNPQSEEDTELSKNKDQIQEKLDKAKEELSNAQEIYDRRNKYNKVCFRVFELRDALNDLINAPNPAEIAEGKSEKSRKEIILEMLNDKKLSRPLALERVQLLLAQEDNDNELGTAQTKIDNKTPGSKLYDRMDDISFNTTLDTFDAEKWEVLFQNGIHPDLENGNIPIRANINGNNIVFFLTGVSSDKTNALITPLYIKRVVTNDNIFNFVEYDNEIALPIKEFSKIWRFSPENEAWRNYFYSKDPMRKINENNWKGYLDKIKNALKNRYPLWLEQSKETIKPYLNILKKKQGSKYNENLAYKKIYKDFKRIYLPAYINNEEIMSLSRYNLPVYIEWLISRENKKVNESVENISKWRSLIEKASDRDGYIHSMRISNYYAPGRVKMALYKAGVSENCCIIPFTHNGVKKIVTEVVGDLSQPDSYVVLNNVDEDGKPILKGEGSSQYKLMGKTKNGEETTIQGLANILRNCPEKNSFIPNMPVDIWEASKTPATWNNIRKLDKRGEYIDLSHDVMEEALRDYEQNNPNNIEAAGLVQEYDETIKDSSGTRPVSERLKRVVKEIAKEANVVLRKTKEGRHYQIFSPYEGYTQKDKPNFNNRANFKKISNIG